MQLTPDQTIDFHPFTCQPDQDGFIVGRPETNTFLALPEEGVRLLSWLQAGKTIAETNALYQHTYGENPDLEDFVEAMTESGLVRLPEVEPSQAEGTDVPLAKPAASMQPQLVQYHMTWLSESLARKIFSRTALLFYALLAASAITLIAVKPGVFPSRSDFVFKQNTALWFICFLLFQLTTVMIHEIGHLAAARSKGVKARFGFGNRMWIIVAETDLTGIWSIPKRDRMLPLLGGPLVDVVILSFGTFLLFGFETNAIVWTPQLEQFARGMYLFICFRLVWQCYFFVRTDFYYVFTTTFECKDLLNDTQNFVMNKIKRLTGIGTPVDQSAIGAREMKYIKLYSWIWFVGRSLAIFVLIFYISPILWSYAVMFYNSFTGLSEGNLAPAVDSMVVIGISMAIYGIGFVMWGRSLFRNLMLRGSKA